MASSATGTAATGLTGKRDCLFRMPIKMQKLHPAAIMPVYATEGSAGSDLFALEAVTVYPGQLAIVPTGLALAIPNGFEGQIRPRSGLAAKHRITVLNAPGTVDADFRGEIKVILINHGSVDFQVLPGMRIAQLVIVPVVRALFDEVASLDETVRGTGGLGSTGIETLDLPASQH